MVNEDSVRLNKFISEQGICSRREADKHIEKGGVTINGKKAKIGDIVNPGDKVNVNGQIFQRKTKEDFVFIAFNKPVGVTTTTEISDRNNIIDYVNHSERIFPIGRLDKDSQGLIFLTNNGDIVNKILRAGNKHEKEYLVTVDKAITDKFLEGMANGVPILGEMTKKCVITKETPFIFRIILIQGMNRQVRRMCENFGYVVTKLERVRIMNIRLKGLQIGEWRDLDEMEVASIFKMIEKSKSFEPKQIAKKPKERDLDSEPFERKVRVKAPRQSYSNGRLMRDKSATTEKRSTEKRPIEKKEGPKKSIVKKSKSFAKPLGATNKRKGKSGPGKTATGKTIRSSRRGVSKKK